MLTVLNDFKDRNPKMLLSKNDGVSLIFEALDIFDEKSVDWDICRFAILSAIGSSLTKESLEKIWSNLRETRDEKESNQYLLGT